MSYYYEWPANKTEANIFYKEVFRINGFWKELAKKMTFGVVQAGGDIGIKLAWWQYMFGGTNSPADFTDANSFKFFAVAQAAAIPFCWTGIPFETARRAYFADKTWPLEYRRGYTSPTQALFRIPFEEGPTYLFKGGFPIMMQSYLFWATYLMLYSWLKNHTYFLWLYHDYNYEWIKFGGMSVSFFFASVASYPAYFCREMVDLWPKERGGHCTWNNSYRQAFRWQY